jgi:2-haloacid dehalogenase
MDLDYGRFEALTFDCYGTLIDWEAGILAGIRAVLEPRAMHPTDDDLLERYAAAEADLESGPYRRYREILGLGLARVAAGYGLEPTAAEVEAFGDSVRAWPAFPDSPAALARLK